jgi:hypothetical protein
MNTRVILVSSLLWGTLGCGSVPTSGNHRVDVYDTCVSGRFVVYPSSQVDAIIVATEDARNEGLSRSQARQSLDAGCLARWQLGSGEVSDCFACYAAITEFVYAN